MNTKKSKKPDSKMAPPTEVAASNIRLSANPRIPPANPQMVSQEQLEEFEAKRKEMWKVMKDYQRQKADLRDQLANGAKIEPGSFVLMVQSRRRKWLTEANLTAVLGEAEVDQLKETIKPGRSMDVVVARAQDDDE